MTVIREDQHGLYIKAGGYIFRPIHPVGYDHVYPDGTRYKAGERVKARHIGGTPIGVVYLTPANKEHWHSHGAYIGNPEYRGSESCYKPDYQTWRDTG